MALKIGVDARPLAQSMTGIRRYTQEMCKALSCINDVELYLYSPWAIADDVLLEIKAARVRMAQAKSGISRQIWAETYLPYWARKDDIDVYWGPCHRLPYLLPDHIVSALTIHDLAWKYAGNTMRRVTRWLDRVHMPSVTHRANKIIAVSQATAHAIQQEFSVNPEDIHVISPAATTIRGGHSSDILKRLNLVKPFILFVGTLEPRKNLARLLKSYAGLPESLRQQTPIVIAGDQGWGNVDLAKLVEQLSLQGQVYLVGVVDEYELAELYAHAYLLAMPSLYEGFGIPLVEAMAQGVPALTSNTSSMPEVASQSAVLVDPQDTGSIRKGLRRLLEDKELHASLAAQTKQNAARYHWDIAAQQMYEVFRSAHISRVSGLTANRAK